MAELSGMWEMQIRVAKGEWVSIGIPKCAGLPNPPPYRYDFKADAVAMLDKLCPNVAGEDKRIVRV